MVFATDKLFSFKIWQLLLKRSGTDELSVQKLSEPCSFEIKEDNVFLTSRALTRILDVLYDLRYINNKYEIICLYFVLIQSLPATFWYLMSLLSIPFLCCLDERATLISKSSVGNKSGNNYSFMGLLLGFCKLTFTAQSFWTIYFIKIIFSTIKSRFSETADVVSNEYSWGQVY